MSVFLKRVDRGLAQRVDRLRPIAQRHGMTLAQLALAWLLRREAVTSVIIGASRAEQVAENCQRLDADLTAEDMGQIDALFPAAENP